MYLYVVMTMQRYGNLLKRSTTPIMLYNIFMKILAYMRCAVNKALHKRILCSIKNSSGTTPRNHDKQTHELCLLIS